MLDTLYEMFTSKKFIAAIAGMIVAAALKIGLEVDTESVGLIVGSLIAYIVGQCWADTGKEVAKIVALTEATTEKQRAVIKVL